MTKKQQKNDKYEIMDNNSMDVFLKFIVTLSSLVIFILLFYFASSYFLKKDQVLTANFVQSLDNEILASEIFNQNEKEYFVIIYNSKEDILETVSSIGDNYNNIPIYVIDTHKAFNNYLVSNKINIKSSKSSDIRVTEPSVIKVVNGKNVKSVSGLSDYTKFFEK